MGKPPYGRYKSRSPKKSRRPETVPEAIERIREFVLQLFIRDDGEGVDWSMIAAALFRLAFYAVDRMPGGQRRYSLLYRVEEGALNRITVRGTETYVEAGPPSSPPPPDWSEGPEAHWSDAVQ
jgi:hypothetical protein